MRGDDDRQKWLISGRESAHDVRFVALDHVADAVLVVENGLIVYANEPTAVMFAIPIETLLGCSIEVLVPEEARPSHRRQRKGFTSRRVDRRMGRTDLDIEGRRGDGTRFPIDVKLSFVEGTGLVVATVRDMTESRHIAVDRAIDRLSIAAAERRIERLVSAHDLVVQRLFGLGAHLQAIATKVKAPTAALVMLAAREVDTVIDLVRRGALEDSPANEHASTEPTWYAAVS